MSAAAVTDMVKAVAVVAVTDIITTKSQNEKFAFILRVKARKVLAWGKIFMKISLRQNFY